MYPLLSWTGEFVGPIGSVPLSAMEAALVGVTTAAMTVVVSSRGGYLTAGLVWVAGESLRAVVPFGGFPWAKIAFSQVDGPLVALATVGGTPLVSLAVAVSGSALAELTRRLVKDRRLPRRSAAAAVAALLPFLGGLAAVQGNVPRAGLDLAAQRRAVLDNHVNRTLELAADVRAGRTPQPDLVIWPENSSDIDPFTNPDAYTSIQAATTAIGAPVAVGRRRRRKHHHPTQHRRPLGPVNRAGDSYTKRRLQPFGKTMPFRSFFRLFSPDVDRAGRFVPGTQATVCSPSVTRGWRSPCATKSSSTASSATPSATAPTCSPYRATTPHSASPT